MAGRPFVDSFTKEQLETAANKHDAYLAARRVGSVKSLAAHYGVSQLTMSRRLKAFKEKRDGTCH